ncbi:hypothetical protein EVG20_g6352 [Dentipellis fragilis]|uniref:Thioredoxin domain-containing protein n=1 Tax=Dentipellis fragilis TaxID=205917 RepID=A0A4Y9YLB8_9AGAM|nr:hypothetical protein EVG20_g6352 [Dentipellis fragilis]
MRFWPLAQIARIPCSLLIASLTLAGLALPVQSESLVLTPDNFKDTIAHGYWFIEHFSPYCGHCRDFAPTWNKLVDDYAPTQVHLAQVNCAVNGDLCSENGVQGYPHMNIYHDGKYLDQFKGIRSREHLDEFLAKHASSVLAAATSAQAPPPSEAAKADVKVHEEPPVDVNPNGQVLKLTPANFANVVQEGGVFVKFFAPWCGHCKKLAPTWVKLAKEMQNKLTIAEVDCEDHKALCREQGINGFPMLFFYAPGGTKTEYTGNRKLEPLRKWSEKTIKPSVQELVPADLEAVIAEHPVLYLFIHQPGDSHLIDVVSRAARPLLGSPPVYTAGSAALSGRLSIPSLTLPALIALKDHDSHPTSVFRFSATTSQAELSEWLLNNRLPTAMELGDGSFQEVMNAPTKPLVVLTAVPDEGAERERLIKSVKEVALAWRHRGDAHRNAGDRRVVFVWMDADRWSKWLKNMYGIEGSGRVIITDHSKLLYYDRDPSGEQIQLEVNSVLAALDGAMKGKGAKHSENIVERLTRYLNGRMIAIEEWIKSHRALTLLIIALGAVLAFFGVRKILADDDAQYYNHAPGKQGRLD